MKTSLCVAFLLTVVSYAAFPTQNQERATVLKVKGLRNDVRVWRDDRGIPYIEAATEADLYFAQGYVTASDRLWQMDLLRRTGRGELAEIVGQTGVQQDRRRRTLGLGRAADDLASKLKQPAKDVLDAYANGVNAYIQSLADKLPAEFTILRYKPQPWRPSDSLVIEKLFSETLSTTWGTDLMRAMMAPFSKEVRDALLPVTSPLDVILVGSDRPGRSVPAKAAASYRTVPAFACESCSAGNESVAASNSWVVNGRHSATGRPLIANDPHLGPAAPGMWYMTHLTGPGLRVAGVTIPGIPTIIIGHNNRIAWGITNFVADVQDIYIETFDPSKPTMYKTPEGWREAKTFVEEIKVRNGPSINVEVSITRHGPIVLANNTGKYALQWTGSDSGTAEVAAFYAINRAGNWNEFRSALKEFTGPPQSFVYSDVNGHIGYYGAGKIPIRQSGDGSLPYDGSTDEGEWRRYIPFEELPHVFDPTTGIIVNANNRVTGTDYPYSLATEWVHPNRARRILDLLQSRPKLSINDFRSIQADTYSIAGKRFADEIEKIVPGLLPAWDGKADPESRGAVLVAALRDVLQKRILGGLGNAAFVQFYSWNMDTFLERVIIQRPDILLPKEFSSYPQLIRASLEEARGTLSMRLGTDEAGWTWGKLNPIRFHHPLDVMPGVGQPFQIEAIPQIGSAMTGPGATVNTGGSVSMRMVADVGDWNNTEIGLPLGQSGDPTSPHWRDQWESWRNVRTPKFPFSGVALTAVRKQGLVLSPAP